MGVQVVQAGANLLHTLLRLALEGDWRPFCLTQPAVYVLMASNWLLNPQDESLAQRGRRHETLDYFLQWAWEACSHTLALAPDLGPLKQVCACRRRRCLWLVAALLWLRPLSTSLRIARILCMRCLYIKHACVSMRLFKECLAHFVLSPARSPRMIRTRGRSCCPGVQTRPSQYSTWPCICSCFVASSILSVATSFTATTQFHLVCSHF